MVSNVNWLFEHFKITFPSVREKETSLFSARFLKISLSFLAGTVNLVCCSDLILSWQTI